MYAEISNFILRLNDSPASGNCFLSSHTENSGELLGSLKDLC